MYLQTRRSIILFVLTLFCFCSCSKNSNQKMPITTTSDKAKNYFLTAREMADRLDLIGARDFFKLALEEDSNFALAHLYNAFVQPTTKSFMLNFNQAKNNIDNVSEAEKLLILGYEAGSIARDFKQQEEYFLQLVEMYPKDERVHFNLANHYFFRQSFDDAIKEYKIAADIRPDLSPVYNQLGYSYRFLERYEEAEDAFEHYIALVPDDPNPYDSFAELLMKTGKFEASIKNYEKALEISPDFLASYIGIASNLNFLSRHKEARERLKEAFKIANDDGGRRALQTAIVTSYIDEGNFNDALKATDDLYRMAADIHDTTSMANDLIIKGNILIEMNEPDKALTYFETALDLTNSSSVPPSAKDFFEMNHLYNISQVYIARNNLDRAKTRINKYGSFARTTANNNMLRSFYELNGRIALEEKNYKAAIKALIQADQQNPYTYYRLAQAYNGLGDPEKAESLYYKAAHFNIKNSLNYAFIRKKTLELLVNM